MITHIDAVLEEFCPVSLEEMNGVRLMNRIDTKYVLPLGRLTELLEKIKREYLVQEIEGKRIGAYYTIYFDTERCSMYLAHQNGKRVREKIRLRYYLDSRIAFLEIKDKDNRRHTDKKRIRISGEEILPGEKGEKFLKENARYLPAELQPYLKNWFYRITLVNCRKTERLTMDIRIRFENVQTGQSSSLEELVIVELKRAGNSESPVRDILRRMHVNPVGFSKYCMGAVLTDPQIKYNRFKPKLRMIRKMISK